jgi:hypothetical protein
VSVTKRHLLTSKTETQPSGDWKLQLYRQNQADFVFFPSHASVSPGLTVIANALRVGDRLIQQLK